MGLKEFPPLLSILFSESGSLNNARTQCLANLARQLALDILSLPLEGWNYRLAWTPALFHVGSAVVNSGPQACAASVLSLSHLHW